jgi:hypothetical protein
MAKRFGSHRESITPPDDVCRLFYVELTGTDIEVFGLLFAQASHAHLAVRLTNQPALRRLLWPNFLARCGCGPRVFATVVMEAHKPDRTQPAMTAYDCTFRAGQPYH